MAGILHECMALEDLVVHPLDLLFTLDIAVGPKMRYN